MSAAAVMLGACGALARHGAALADEYVYLAGARHLSLTGSLDARFYDAGAILLRGHPHQDVHAPGYVILLGALTAVVRGGYWTAVALNVAAYVAGAFLTRALARSLGFSERAAWWTALFYLVLPAFLPYVFWAMPEVVLGALFLGAAVAAARWGDRAWGAVTAGVLLGAGLLVRETVVFGLPAVGVLLTGRKRIAWFLATVVLFVALVHAPLSRDRAPGGVNFWAGPPRAVRTQAGFSAVHAARRGDVRQVVASGWHRLRSNLRRAADANAAEKGILALFVALPAWALARRRTSSDRARRFLVALAAGWAALLVSILVLFTLDRWSGFRYLMFLMPGFLPWTAATRETAQRGPRAWGVAAGVACLVVNGEALAVHNAYKESRIRRQEGLAEYVARYVAGRPFSRIVLPSGWRFGLDHYPAEVVSSLPRGGGELRLLEQALWFDYLVLPGDSPLGDEWDGRARYLRINADDSAPPFKVYRRLR